MTTDSHATEESKAGQQPDAAGRQPAHRAADRLVETLTTLGVERIFGVPGAKIDNVYDALVDQGPELIVCRHEQNAAFMAGAVGRLTGRPGVVLVTSGPGTTNLGTGLLTANTEGDPIVALCGAVPRADRLKRSHQSMHAAAFLQTLTKYAGEVDDPGNVSEAVHNAFRIATTEPRGATALVLPNDVMAADTQKVISDPVPIGPLGPAPTASIEAAAQMIQKAQRPILLLGAHCGDPVSCEAIRALLRTTGLAAVETFQAAGVVSRELESHYVGRVGFFRNQPGDILVAESDLVIAIGYDPVEYDPHFWNPDGRCTIIHIDPEPADIDNDYQPVLELRGDIAQTVEALTQPLTGHQVGPAFAERITACQRDLHAIDEQARGQSAEPGKLNPVDACLLLREQLDDTATVACDIGSHYIHMCRHFRVYEPRHLLVSDGQQTLGVALPWAMASAMVRPGTPVVSVSGDGGFLFSAQELETATRLGLNFTHILLRDDTYDMVGFQQLIKFGRKSGVQLGDYDVTDYAATFGAHGHRVHDRDEFVATLKHALQEPGVSIIDVPVDYSHNVELAGKLAEDAFE